MLKFLPLIFTVIFTFSSCQAAAEDTPQPGCGEITTAVMNEIEFRGATEIAVNDIRLYYSIDIEKIDEMSFFTSVNSFPIYPDEIAVFKFFKVSEAEGSFGALQERLEYLKETFKGNEANLKQLEAPICQQFGLYLVFCNCMDNEKADEIITKMFTNTNVSV
ncbi:MAG: DUF4358 domain-containing protein [Ruminococcus sp.]|jgi:hypothetical protein|nr:DUF4358 domain-containing protein [Ruminococcus sp.]